jgi:signal transduction histidine kinase
LAESTARFTQDLNHSKEMFLAMLGHDLRTPLGAIIGWAHILVQAKDLPDALLNKASQILNSGQRMNALVGDILDFTRSRLGGGIPIVRAEVDIARVCRQSVGEIAALYPQRVVNFEATGDVRGQWDSARTSQAFVNVLNNAIQHGSDSTPVNVEVRGSADEVSIAVQNLGPVIASQDLDRIFDPMHRIEGDRPVAPRSNLGLGLYITDRIVAAHGGTIDVSSSEAKGTTFVIHLPKHARTAA